MFWKVQVWTYKSIIAAHRSHFIQADATAMRILQFLHSNQVLCNSRRGKHTTCRGALGGWLESAQARRPGQLQQLLHPHGTHLAKYSLPQASSSRELFVHCKIASRHHFPHVQLADIYSAIWIQQTCLLHMHIHFRLCLTKGFQGCHILSYLDLRPWHTF